MKTTHRISSKAISGILAIMLVITMIPAAVFAAPEGSNNALGGGSQSEQGTVTPTQEQNNQQNNQQNAENSTEGTSPQFGEDINGIPTENSGEQDSNSDAANSAEQQDSEAASDPLEGDSNAASAELDSSADPDAAQNAAQNTIQDAAQDAALSTLSNNSPFSIGPLSTITDGVVTIDIPAYDGTAWNNMEIKDVVVSVDFGDNTTANKTIEIELPEGLRFESIPAKAGLSLTNVDAAILNYYAAADPEYAAITSMSVPQKETVKTFPATFGKVTYNLTAGTRLITFNFKVSVDGSKHYGPHSLTAPIKATASKGGSQCGQATQSITATGASITPETGASTLHFYDLVGYSETKELIQSPSATDLSKGRSPQFTNMLNNWSTQITALWVKKITLTLHYPREMTFVSVTGLGNYSVVSNDQSTGTVVVETTDAWATRNNMRLNYAVPYGLGTGTYSVAASDTLQYTYYDGTLGAVITNSTKVSSVPYLWSVKIVDSTTIANKMAITNSRDVGMDTAVESYINGPSFNVGNTTAGEKTDQVFEFTIDPNLKVVRVQLPFDSTSTGFNGANPLTVEYQTNLNSSWRTHTATYNTFFTNGQTKRIEAATVGLATGEYFTGVRANMGSFKEGYSVGAAITDANMVNVWGHLDSTVDDATVTLFAYNEDDRANTEVTATKTARKAPSLVPPTNSLSVSSNGSTTSFTQTAANGGATIGSTMAGGDFRVKATLTVNAADHLNKTTLVNPIIYIRQPDKLTINPASFVLQESVGNTNVTHSYTSRIDPNGETFYKIETQNLIIGGHFYENNSLIRRSLNISFDVSTDLRAQGTYDIREIMTFGSAETFAPTTDNFQVLKDVYDFDDDGNMTENMLSFLPNNFSILENRNVLVETFLSLAGEAPKAPFVDTDASTTAYFTPGTDADYTFKITNNGTADAAAYTAYVPIPKTGDNFGSEFQSAAFNWNLKLTGLVASQTGFAVSYASNATEANYRTDAIYQSSPSDLSTVNMVKITATTAFSAGAAAEFKVPLKVDETFASATAGSKIGTKDVYNPVYDVTSATYIGTLRGTKAGAELVIAEIGGTVFKDKNADGLFKTIDGDTAVASQEVKLYKLDATDTTAGPGGTYKAVQDASTAPIAVTTDSNGNYLFDYTNGLGYGTYAVEFVEPTGGVAQEYTINNTTVGSEGINSDAIVKAGLPTAGDNYRGWVLGIDATLPAAKTIGCGFLEYDPPVDLRLDFVSAKEAQTVKVGANIDVAADISSVDPVVVRDISPDFFDSIKDSAAAYTWELVDPADSQYVTLTNANTKTVNIAGVKKTFGKTSNGKPTVTVQLTIKDIYGTTAVDTIEITVNTNVAPSITLPANVDAFVGDNIPDSWQTGLSAQDDNGAAITLTSDTNLSIDTSTVPVTSGKYSDNPGTYAVVYEVTDAYGNQNSATRVVRVSGVPQITAANQNYRLSLGASATDTAVTAAASAKYVKADATIGTSAADTSVAPVSYTITAGPSTASFNAAGAYTVQYSATAEGKAVTSDVTVNVVAPYTVAFDTKGNTAFDATSGALGDQSVYATDSSFSITGDAIASVTAPVKTGQTFKGWYYQASDVANPNSSLWTLWNFGTTLTKDLAAADTDGDNSKFTLRAAYTIDAFTLTYDLNDGGDLVHPAALGAGGAATDSVDYATDISGATHFSNVATDAKAPVRDGYTFDGWFLEAAGTTAVGTTTMPGSARSIFAKWSAIDYNISYTLNGGANAAGNPAKYNAGDNFPINIAAATRAGYSFDGWTATGAITEATAIISPQIPNSALGEISLVANWSVDLADAAWATVQFDANGGVGAPGDILYNTVEAKLADGALFPAAIPSRIGYTFANWNTLANGSGQVVADVANLSGVSTNTTLFATWNANGNTAYKTEHYLVEADGSFTLANTDNLTAQTDTTANAASRTYAYYTLDGTHAKTTASGNVAGDGSLVLQLYYPINRFSVSYGVTGAVPAGAPAAPATTNDVAYGTNVTVAAPLSFSGYTFSGWSSSSVSGANFSMPNSNVVFTGRWTVVPVVPVTPVTPVVPVVPVTPVVPTNPQTPAAPVTPVVPTTPAATTTDPITGPTATTTIPGTPQTVVIPGLNEDEHAQIAEQTGNPLVDIPGGNVPLGNIVVADAWSMSNLLLMILGILEAALLLLALIRRRAFLAAANNNGRTFMAVWVVAFFLSLAQIGIFFPVENIGQPVVWFNQWTPLFVGVFVLSTAVSLVWARLCKATTNTAAFVSYNK